MEKPKPHSRNMTQPPVEPLTRWSSAREKFGRKVVAVVAATGMMAMAAACSGGPQTSGGAPVHYELDYTKGARSAEALRQDADRATAEAKKITRLVVDTMRDGKQRHHNGSGENVWTNTGHTKQKGIIASVAYDGRQTDKVRVSYADTIDGQPHRLTAVLLMKDAQRPQTVWDISDADLAAQSISGTRPGMTDAIVTVSFSEPDNPRSPVEDIDTNTSPSAQGNTPDTAVSNEIQNIDTVYQLLARAA